MSALFIQQLVNGLTLGAVYTLIALSFSLVMGILGILNLAIGELFMIGAYFGFTLLLMQLPLPLALLAAMIGAGLISVIIAKVGYERLRNAPLITPMLSTLGFSLILQNVATNFWGSDPMQLSFDAINTRYTIAGIGIGVMQIVVLGVTVVLVGLMALIVQRTQVGRALRAVAENREVAKLLGVSANRIVILAFVLSGILAGAAGILVGLHYATITPYMGIDIGMKAIAVMVVGGATRIWGALLAGPLIGIAEVMTVSYGASSLRDFVVYGLMILILLLRPQGLLGGSGAMQGGRV